jgi:hypothetical protein
MKKGILIDIDWKYIGAELACQDDKTQTEFFKSFIKEINSFGTYYQGQSQLAEINKNLNSSEKKDLSIICFIGE